MIMIYGNIGLCGLYEYNETYNECANLTKWKNVFEIVTFIH